MKEEKNYKNATCIILFLLFHECCGHQKKNINNKNIDTPRKHHDNNFIDFSVDKVDTVKAFEIILFGEIIVLKFLMKNGNLEKLLDFKLYIGKNFDNLRKIILNLETNEENKKENEKEEKPIIIKQTKQKEKKVKSNRIENKAHLIYHDLFRIYANINDEQKKSLERGEGYQRFLKLYKKRKKRLHLLYQDL